MSEQIDIEKIYSYYLQTGSVHKAGVLIGLSGETVRCLLKKHGKKLNRGLWTKQELEAVWRAYLNPNGVDVAVLAKTIGKTYASVALKASRLGISSKRGKQIRTPKHIASYSKAQKKLAQNPEIISKRSRAVSEAFKRNGHPRGMLGKRHSQAAKNAISRSHLGKPLPREQVMKAMKTRIKRFGSLCPNKQRGTWKAEWVEINGVRFFARSKWEANYAHYLEWLRLKGIVTKWEHEPETFWFDKIKRGVVSYLPDFRVTLSNGNVEYHEVKGWMDSRSKTKIKRMRIYHPKVHLEVVDSKRYKALERQMKSIVPNWR